MVALLEEKQPGPQHPLMTISAVQQGLLVTIMRSAVEKHELLLPMNNIVALLPDILGMLPNDALHHIMQSLKEKQKGRDLVQAAMRHPALLKAVH